SDGNGSHASTLKSPSYTKSVSWQHYQSGDVLYPVKITRKSSGKTAFHLVPFGLNKTHDLLEVEDASEAIRLVIDERHSIRCSTLTATITNKKGKRIKRTGIYSIKGVNIKEYNVR
ncbi:hypothetical protein, partial [Shigella boydii]